MGDGPDIGTSQFVAVRTWSSGDRALWMRRLARKDDVDERAERCDQAGELGSALRGLRGETCCSTPGDGANLLICDETTRAAQTLPQPTHPRHTTPHHTTLHYLRVRPGSQAAGRGGQQQLALF